MDGEFYIAQAAKRLGVSSTYLRRLERQKRVPTARRDAFGDRIYNELDLMLLRALGVGSGRCLKRVEEVLEAVR